MNISFSARNAGAVLSALWLLACNGKLTVVDSLDSQDTDLDTGHTDSAFDGGAGGSNDAADAGTDTPVAAPEPGEFVPSGPLNLGCPCAATAALQPLLCDGREVTRKNDVVQLSDDGGVVVFNINTVGELDGPLAYWDGEATRTVSEYSLLALSAGGDRVLTGAPAGLRLLDIGGDSRTLPLQSVGWHSTLSADGRTVIAGDPASTKGRILRAHVDTGAVDTLGDVSVISGILMTPDASTAVGLKYRASSLYGQAFRWSEAAGLTFDWPGVPAGIDLWPEAVSDDGSVITGHEADGGNLFRWSVTDGYLQLPLSGYTRSFVSADGSVLAGTLEATYSIVASAVRWTQATGTVELTPGLTSIALGMSADGSVVAARSNPRMDGPPGYTYVWDSTHGTRQLEPLLRDRGADWEGWPILLGSAYALSKNGKVLVGATTCGGVPTLYRAVLSD